MKLSELSSMAATWIGLAAAIAGGYVTLQTYAARVDKEIDERKLQTFRMMEQFGTREMREIRERLAPLVMSDRFCDTAERAKAGLSDSQMFVFVEFFDLVQTCVGAGLCDADLAYQSFGAYANWHWPAMRRVIEQTRASEQGFDLKQPYGHGLEAMSRRPAFTSSCGAKAQLR